MQLAAPIIAICVLASIALIDWQQHQIWHSITIPSSLAAILAARWLPAHSPRNALLGAIICFTLFWLIRAIANRVYDSNALGFGDVMLALLIGAIGGTVDGLRWLALGMLIGGGVAFWQWRRTRQSRQPIAYGSCLALGAIIGLISTIVMP